MLAVFGAFGAVAGAAGGSAVLGTGILAAFAILTGFSALWSP